jgi:hypothetical protein|tara:strand:+ start:907 stop:1734 length:828 start_codon:yes stop_codon:yes gene_type:complete
VNTAYEVVGTRFSEDPPTVIITPDFDTPLPPSYPRRDESLGTLKEGIRITAATMTFLTGLGMEETPDENSEGNLGDVEKPLIDATEIFNAAYGDRSPDVDEAKRLCGEKVQRKRGSRGPIARLDELKVTPSQLLHPTVAAKLTALVTEYDQKVVDNAAQLRTYITNRLLEVSKCGDARHELRALELLGKVSDVGLFSEKTEINITHTAGALEHALKDKINRLVGIVGSDVEEAEFNEVDITPPKDEESDGSEERPEISESGSSGVQQTQENPEPS